MTRLHDDLLTFGRWLFKLHLSASVGTGMGRRGRLHRCTSLVSCLVDALMSDSFSTTFGYDTF